MVAARQTEVARDYLKGAARIGELNGHPPGSDGQMVAALKRYFDPETKITTEYNEGEAKLRRKLVE